MKSVTGLGDGRTDGQRHGLRAYALGVQRSWRGSPDRSHNAERRQWAGRRRRAGERTQRLMDWHHILARDTMTRRSAKTRRRDPGGGQTLLAPRSSLPDSAWHRSGKDVNQRAQQTAGPHRICTPHQRAPPTTTTTTSSEAGAGPGNSVTFHFFTA
ncbi:hypothetical protein AAFF_G00428520 [Aldrovandia affinis]|uniref:Uncharacterized protein n=1 Tax=Aldrovandia affinis TaxID=143900 RepID=A0AAD7S940_9TELE|nr:hypothetical protein AAFF_G00428520 [Aldrovandia affinis]